MDLETRLGLYYDLDSIIPKSITSSVRGTRAGTPKVPNIQLNSYLDNHATGLRSLKDEAVSHEHRERIAKSLLDGTHMDTSLQKWGGQGHSSQSSAFGDESTIFSEEDYDDSTTMSDLRQTNFLEISSNAVHIPLYSPGQICEERRQYQLDKRNKTKEIYRGPRSALYSLDPSKSQKSKRSLFLDDVVKRESAQNSFSQQSKLERIAKNREELRTRGGEAEKRKELDHHTQISKIKLAKNLKEFRQKLIERLREKENYNASSMMRCVDDSMIHEFMKKYEGYTMSVDTALGMMVGGMYLYIYLYVYII
jgi:hypothetical protein